MIISSCVLAPGRGEFQSTPLLVFIRQGICVCVSVCVSTYIHKPLETPAAE